MTSPPTVSSEELKACPFCGGEAYEAIGVSGDHGFAVRCSRNYCGTSSRGHPSREQAITAWNTRTPPPVSSEIVEMVADAEKAIYGFHALLHDNPNASASEFVAPLAGLTRTVLKALAAIPADPQVEKLIEALRPFANEARQYTFFADHKTADECVDGWEDDAWLADVPTEFRVGDLRRARDLVDTFDV